MTSESVRDRTAFRSALRDSKMPKKSARFGRAMFLEELDRRLQNIAHTEDREYPRENCLRLAGGRAAINNLADMARNTRVSKAWLRTVLEIRIAELALAHRMLDRSNGYAQIRNRPDELCRAYGDFRMCLDIAEHFDLGI